ncbi:hypothetical protein [Brachyspira sp.]|uniref:hypothetical protein n=1 Tax=Brachyspira sp. TaxID=1977261 RepID=UPI003D7CE0AA
MKLHEIIRFKNRIEKRKSYFDLPDLPEKEWNYLLQRARAVNIRDIDEDKISNKLYSFMCSARLSFVLSIAIIMVLAFSLLFSVNINENKNTTNNTASNNRVDVPVVNVSNNSFI